MRVEITWRGKNKSVSYKLKGADVKSIIKELEAREEWGSYSFTFTYTYKIVSGDKISVVDLSPESTITMPSWTAYAQQSQKVRENWDEMYASLKKHEVGHAEIYEKGLAELKGQLEEISEIALSDLVSKVKNATKQWQKLSDDYDKKTEHGKRDMVPLIVG